MCPRNSHPKAILYSSCEFLMHESVLEIVLGTEYTTSKLKKSSYFHSSHLLEHKLESGGGKSG